EKGLKKAAAEHARPTRGFDRADLPSEDKIMRWVLIVAVFALAGCSSVSSVPTHLQTEKTAIQASGGSFSVTDSGNYTLSGCAPPDGNGQFHFRGSGTASFLHS